MFSMIYITTGSKDEAESISNTLLERRLVACANIFPIDSRYWWKDKIEKDSEVAVIFKTRAMLLERTIATIKQLHSYEVPCIVSYEMKTGYQPYLDWISSETKGRE